MVYVDSSALVKRYLQEAGSARLNFKLDQAANAQQPILASVLSFAELHAVFARKLKEGRDISPVAHHLAATRFNSDWRTYFTPVELIPQILQLIPDLVWKHPLKGADGVHLASALWMQARLMPARLGQVSRVRLTFITSDQQLAKAAENEQLPVFDPENPA